MSTQPFYPGDLVTVVNTATALWNVPGLWPTSRVTGHLHPGDVALIVSAHAESDDMRFYVKVMGPSGMGWIPVHRIRGAE